MIDALAGDSRRGVGGIGRRGCRWHEGAERRPMFSPTRRTDLQAVECRRGCHTCTTSLPNTFTRRAPACWRAGAFTWHDDKDAPRVAIVNQEFARRMFGSPTNAIGRYFKMPDGTRVQVVGIAEDGKYSSLTEDPQTGDVSSHPAIADRQRRCWWCAPSAIRSNWPRRSGARCGTRSRAAGFHFRRGTQAMDMVLCSVRAWRRFRWACWA